MSEAAIDFRTIGRPAPGKGNARASGYERQGQDWYVEPASAVHRLLDAECFSGEVLDPACGGGNVVQACLSRGIEAHGSDIVDRANGVFPCIDFFDIADPVDNIISNPPFKAALEFTLHALTLARGKVCILQRTTWLEGARRHEALFSKGYLARMWQFVPRISMPPGDAAVKAHGGSVAFAWYVFEAGHSGPFGGGWLP